MHQKASLAPDDCYVIGAVQCQIPALYSTLGTPTECQIADTKQDRGLRNFGKYS